MRSANYEWLDPWCRLAEHAPMVGAALEAVGGLATLLHPATPPDTSPPLLSCSPLVLSSCGRCLRNAAALPCHVAQSRTAASVETCRGHCAHAHAAWLAYL
jgi:hypothetical protein